MTGETEYRHREVESAWRLWDMAERLSALLWERYEAEFMERNLSELDRRQSIESDEHPF